MISGVRKSAFKSDVSADIDVTKQNLVALQT